MRSLLLKFGPLALVVTAGLAYLAVKPVNLTQAEAAETVRRSCQQEADREQCYAKTFAKVAKERDMDFAFETLGELQKIDPQANGCHFIAHSITIAETEKDPGRWKEIMKRAPQNCSYGGAHGALEVHAASFPGGKLPKAKVLTVCDVPDTTNCTHILGHLILVMQNNDIPSSTSLCRQLPHDSRGIFECLTGVFMERITAINLVAHGLADQNGLNWPARLPELKTLCQGQNGINATACWKEITHVALTAFNYDSQKMMDLCRTAKSSGAAVECEDHAVGIIAGHKNFELTNLGTTCRINTTDATFEDRCYAQLVSATLSTLPYASGKAVSFCNNLSLPNQKECFTMIGNTLHGRQQDIATNLEKACRDARQEYRNLCLRGGPSAYKPVLSLD